MWITALLGVSWIPCLLFDHIIYYKRKNNELIPQPCLSPERQSSGSEQHPLHPILHLTFALFPVAWSTSSPEFCRISESPREIDNGFECISKIDEGHIRNFLFLNRFYYTIDCRINLSSIVLYPLRDLLVAHNYVITFSPTLQSISEYRCQDFTADIRKRYPMVVIKYITIALLVY